MADLIKRLRSTRSCTVCDGDGIKDNGKQCGGCGGEGQVLRYDRTGTEAADEIDRLRTGIKRLSDEEELCAETTGDDPFSLVYLAAKLARTEHDLASAEGRAKNATSDLQYWRGQYEAVESSLRSVIEDLEARSKGGLVDLSHGVYSTARAALTTAKEGE